MSVIKFQRDITDLFNYPSDQNPTTQADYISAVKNWQETERNLVDAVLWQPETAYSVGNIAKTPSLSSQYILVCTEAGDSGVAEPDYTDVSIGDTVVDGTATWLVSTIVNGGNIDALTTAVEANTQAIGEHSTAIATNTQNIATNTADIATNTANIAINASDIANNATDIEVADKRISNIEKLLQGNLYDYQTDDTSAYTKTVPAGAMPYAGLEKLGGKTVVMNQLLNAGTINITTTTTNQQGLGNFVGVNTHTYLLLWYQDTTLTSNTRNTMVLNDADSSTTALYCTPGSNVSLSAGWYSWLVKPISLTNGTFSVLYWGHSPNVAYNITNIMCFDLTLMFGAGNEPTTIEQFRKMFPADYYEYNAGTLLSAGVTEVVSKKADTTTIATYSVPAEIQALEGYGWSAGSVYNYIDYERKVFVKNVGAVDLGTLTYSRGVSSVSGLTYFDNHTITNKKVFPQNQPANLVCAKFIPTADNKSAPAGSSYGIMYSLDAYITLYADYPDVPTFQSAMNGVYLYYELATPIETDISEYITDDNLIEVEAGGTLTFENQHGDDYRIPVPSEETYMINLQEAVSNG